MRFQLRGAYSYLHSVLAIFVVEFVEAWIANGFQRATATTVFRRRRIVLHAHERLLRSALATTKHAACPAPLRATKPVGELDVAKTTFVVLVLPPRRWTNECGNLSEGRWEKANAHTVDKTNKRCTSQQNRRSAGNTDVFFFDHSR